MAKKTTTKKKNAEKSKLGMYFTPASKRNLNVTYVKSAPKPTFPNKIASQKSTVSAKNKKLRELGLSETLWKTYRVNALYDFCYQKPMLRRYELRLKSIIEADLSKLGSDSQHKYKHIEVEMQYFYSMAFTNNDFPPLKIIIDTADESDGVYFTGILLSVERTEGFMENERRYAGAAILPLFLVSYTDRIFFESVKYFLEDKFSCLVSPLKFSSYDLVWMLALFCPKYDLRTGASFIEYACPFKELKTLQLAVDPFTIVEIWNKVVDPNVSRTVHEKQVFNFLQILEYHFFKIFGINLSEFNLQAIKTPLARVTADHSILLYDTKKLYFVMCHLTHLAQETIKLRN